MNIDIAHSDGRVEEVGEPEEGGGVADGDHQEGGQEGHHGLEQSIEPKRKGKI